MSSRFQVPGAALRPQGARFLFKAALVGLFSGTLLGDIYAYLATNVRGDRIQIACAEFATYFGLMLLLWLAFGDDLRLKNWMLAGLIGGLLYALSTGLLLGVISPAISSEPFAPIVIFERLFTGAISAVPIGIVLRARFPRWYLWIIVNSIGSLFLQLFNHVLLWSYHFKTVSSLFFNSFFVGQLASAITWGIARILFSLMLGIVLYRMMKTQASSSRYAGSDSRSETDTPEPAGWQQIPVAKFFFKVALVGLFSAGITFYYSAGLSGYKISTRSVILNSAVYFALVLLLWLAFEDYLYVRNWIFAGLIGSLLYALSVGLLLDVISDKPSESMFIFERLFTGAISAIPIGMALRARFPGWYLWIVVNSVGCLLWKFFVPPFFRVPYLIEDLPYRELAYDTSMWIPRILFSLILGVGLYWITRTGIWNGHPLNLDTRTLSK